MDTVKYAFVHRLKVPDEVVAQQLKDASKMNQVFCRSSESVVFETDPSWHVEDGRVWAPYEGDERGTGLVYGPAVVASEASIHRLLLLSALSIALLTLLTLLGAAGERLGYDRWLKANTVKRHTHSLFRQGLVLYEHIPNWPEHRLRPLVEKFSQMLMEQRVYREIFDVI